MNLLLAEDNLDLLHPLQKELTRWGYRVTGVSDGTAAWHVLQQDEAPQLLVLDWTMPGMDGLEICRQVRQRPSPSYPYILLLTAHGDQQDVIDGLEAGADDYLVKPFDLHELKARLNAGRRILDLQDRLRRQATQDSLTGLWNHGAILDLLDRELARARRQRTSVGVVLADLDHFKAINDTYGHLAGDGVLREAARRLRAGLRPYDEIGRYGGEEFLMVLPGCGAADTAHLAERLRQALGTTAMALPEGRIAVTVSLGMTTAGPDAPADVTALLRSADGALYRAKQAGRNRVEAAPPSAEGSQTRAS